MKRCVGLKENKVTETTYVISVTFWPVQYVEILGAFLVIAQLPEAIIVSFTSVKTLQDDVGS